MSAHPEDVEAGPERHQRIADPLWHQSALRPIPPRRAHWRARQDRGVGRAPALSGTRSRLSRVADVRCRRPGRREPKGGSTDRLAGEGIAAAGQVRRRQVGLRQAGLDLAPRCGRASRSAASGHRWRWLDVVTWWIDLGTVRVDRCRHRVVRCRHRCLDLFMNRVSG